MQLAYGIGGILYSGSESMKFRRFIQMFMAICFVMTAIPVCAQDGLRGAQARLASTAAFLQGLFEQRFVAADFDNDQKPDGAVLVNAGRADGEKTFRIELHISTRENSQFTFGSSERELAISVLDVNRDGAPDIVLRQAITHKVLQVWVNDGRGSFRMASTEELGLVPGEGPWQVSRRSRLQDCPLWLLAARSRDDHGTLGSASILLPSLRSSPSARIELERVDSPGTAATCVRGPPRFFFLSSIPLSGLLLPSA